jgi:hypothetical protein
MRIVTCAAPQLVSGRLLAAAGIHAFDMACAPKRGTFRIVIYKIRYVVSEALTSFELRERAIRPRDPGLSQQVTLPADIIAPLGVEAGRKHHSCLQLDVLGAWAMTSLAGNARLTKRSFCVAIDATVDVRQLTRVTQQATWVDWPIPRHSGVVLVARRRIPTLLLGIPGDWGLEKISVTKDEVTEARGS